MKTKQQVANVDRLLRKIASNVKQTRIAVQLGYRNIKSDIDHIQSLINSIYLEINENVS